MLTDAVRTYISRFDLMPEGGKYLVALSGGADSVALMLVLKELGYDIEAVHCNFHLRGVESDRDEHFCQNLCETERIPLHLAHFDTTTYAQLHKVSIEMAARELRYNYFEQLRKDLNAAGICVAHHKEDSVETVLLNLIRGTGIDGLTGISPKNGYILRPLLGVTRQEIEDYLASRHQSFVTDSSNLKDDVKRNKIRLDVLPLLQTINPSVVDNIYQTSQYLREAQKMLSRSIDYDKYKDGSFQISDLLAEPSTEYVLWSLLKPYGFTPSQVENICNSLNGVSGKEWTSATHVVVKDRTQLIVEAIPQHPLPTLRIPEEGLYRYSEKLKLRFRVFDKTSDYQIEREKTIAVLDADKVHFPLTVRPVQNADSFVPFGMRQSKLLSDYLTDIKKNILEKRRQLVITQSDGSILWVVNERPDHRFRVTNDTKRILRISSEV